MSRSGSDVPLLRHTMEMEDIRLEGRWTAGNDDDCGSY